MIYRLEKNEQLHQTFRVAKTKEHGMQDAIMKKYDPSTLYFPSRIFLFLVPLLFCNPATFAADKNNEELLQQLKNRDAIIADLLRRVERLEQKTEKAGGQPANSASSNPTSSAAPAQGRKDSQQTGPAVAVQENKVQQAPGSVSVDERAADRALERTLTIQGALLLPKGVKEITPYTSYARRETRFPDLLSLNDNIVAGSQEIERDEISIGLRGAIGLPFDSQLEINIPYRYVNETRTLRFTGASLGDSSENGTSIGDIKIGIAKTLMQENGWKPDLLARLSWDSDSGDSIDNDIPLGQGFDEFRVSLTALKRQDPLAFTATISYQYALEKNDFQPGDEFGLTLGASMAASPSTSLSIALAQAFQQDLKFDGRKLDGTSADSAVLLFGASSVLSRQTVLAVSAGIGLTRAAPDYLINFSLPIRFW